jgi:hypothetical protein
MIAATSRWLVVSWREIERWDYLSNYQRRTLRCAFPLTTVGEVMTVRRQLATPAELAAGEVRMLDRVSFDGEIFAGERQQTKMDQWIAEPGDIVVSKIRARQGSVGLVEPTYGKISVTIHYRALTPDPAKIDRKYAHLAMRSAYGKAQFLAATGGAMKGEISEDALLKVRLPLPPLAVQRKVVAAWESARKAAAASQARIECLERDIEAGFLADLGLKAPTQTTLPKVFAMRWKDLTRWSVGYIRNAAVNVDATAGKYPAVPLRKCLIDTMNGYCIKPVAGPTAYKMLKLNALQPAGLDLVQSKYIDVPERIAMRFHLRKGDLLICRSVGSFDHIAKCALVESDEPSILFPDIIIRARFTEAMVPEYAREFIQTKVGRTWFQQNARTAVGMWKIGGADIAAFPIPLPPTDVQRQIVERVAKRRHEIAKLRADADARAKAAKADVEAMILGTKPVAS